MAMETVAQIAKRLYEGGISRVQSSTEELSKRELSQMQADAINGRRGDLEGDDCKECKNRGFVAYVDDGDRVCTRECVCMIHRRNMRRLKRSGLEDAVQRYTFETWKTPELWQITARELAEKYAEQRNGWFVVSGNPGTGKTHLCTAIAMRLIMDGLDTQYMLWRDGSVQAKAAVGNERAYAALVEPLKTVPVLYIDDYLKTGKGAEPTTGDVNLAFEILNSRYNDAKKLTIISTERSMDYLLDLDEALGSRIYERSRGYYLDLTGKANWRLS